MHVVGAERVLNTRTLKRHDDALGQFLYVPTLKHRGKAAGENLKSLRSRCEEIAAFIADVLASPVFNAVLADFLKTKCLKCGDARRRRQPRRRESASTRC